MENFLCAHGFHIKSSNEILLTDIVHCEEYDQNQATIETSRVISISMVFLVSALSLHC